MSNTETTDSPRVQLVRSYCEGFSKKDMDHIGKLLHKDHRRVTYPRSLGKADQTKEEYLKQLAQGMSTWTENEASHPALSDLRLPAKSPSQMIIHSITETAGEQVVTHVCIQSVHIDARNANATHLS